MSTLPTPDEHAKKHKEAFRCAFNFLNEHFPPVDDLAWWEQLSKDGSSASIAVGEDRLAIELMVGVMNYLEHEWKRRKEDETGD